MSPFRPAGELLGPDCKVRSIVIERDVHLPSGDYDFIDCYCTDNSCDCRKTIIQVYHEGRMVSVVNFGWEKPEFYVRWMGGGPDDELARDMSGVSIDITSPDIVSREGMLILMKHLLDEKWISILKENYRLIRSLPKPNNILRLPPKITRNAPCPCGSGRKYKNCCI